MVIRSKQVATGRLEVYNKGFDAFEEIPNFSLGPSKCQQAAARAARCRTIIQLPAVARNDFLDPIKADFGGFKISG